MLPSEPVKTPPRLTTEQLGQVLGLLSGADSAELKLTVPESDHYQSLRALQVDPLDARMRQIFFFDTPDLALNAAGVVVRARRIQDSAADTVVKLRPVVPDDLPKKLRKDPSFGVPQGPVDERRRQRGDGWQAAHPQPVHQDPTRVLRGARPRRDRPGRPRRPGADPRPQAEAHASGVRAEARRRALAIPGRIADPRAIDEVPPRRRGPGGGGGERASRFDRDRSLEQATDEDRHGSAVLRARAEGHVGPSAFRELDPGVGFDPPALTCRPNSDLMSPMTIQACT